MSRRCLYNDFKSYLFDDYELSIHPDKLKSVLDKRIKRVLSTTILLNQNTWYYKFA